MKLSEIKTDGHHRVRFFHERGLVPVMPTPEQLYVGLTVPKRLHRAIYHGVLRIRARFRDRILVRPVARTGKALYLANSDEILAGRQDEMAAETFDSMRLRGRLLSVPLLRGAALGVLCPEYLLAGFGLQCGRNLIVNHLLYLPHIGVGPTWDLQLIHADPGGLDWLEQRLAIARARDTFRGRLYYDVAQAGGDVDGWYDTLEKIIPAARHFEYPNMEEGEVTFVEALNRCAALEPHHMEHFRANPHKTVMGNHPEIPWPPAALAAT